MTTWLRELALGARLALAGGRGATLLTAVGVGLGVGLLLLAASVPTALQQREDRGAARDYLEFADTDLPRGDGTLLIATVDTAFQRNAIRGRLVRAEGARPPLPPGVRALPGPGEAVVSPALAALLRARGSELLRARLGARVIGTIGDAGLIGPSELAYYAGSGVLAVDHGSTRRIDRFGLTGVQRRPLDPVLLLLVVVLFVVTLVPLAVFVATAVRFGGEQRDRRLAALRLVGADAGMVRRIAAGETLVAALLGLVLGGLGFLAGRVLAESITVWDVSVFADDLRPGAALAALVVLVVPAVAIVMTLASLRLVVIEPLGVVRRAAGSRRRKLWRLLLPVVGLLLLLPLLGSVRSSGETVDRYQVAAGAALLLIGVAALLPWLVEALVRRLRGVAVAGQLAVRRLQMSSEASARTVSGIAVAAAGVIALQMLFAGVRDEYRTDPAAGAADVRVTLPAGPATSGDGPVGIEARFAGVAGVRWASAVRRAPMTLLTAGAPSSEVVVGSCASLRAITTVERCSEGDAFVVDRDGAGMEETGIPDAGQEVAIGIPDADPAEALPRWTVPASATVVQTRALTSGGGVYATPAAIPAALLRTSSVEIGVGLDPAVPEALDAVRTAAAAVDPQSNVFALRETQEDRRFASIRRGLYLGVAAMLALIGTSMLVALLEGLRQRRRLLAVLVAFGTRRGTLGWSVVLQTAVPVVLGLLLAVAVGVLLGSLLLAMVSRPVALDPASIAVVCAAGVGVVAGVTVLGLPALWRLMRPDGLRTE